MDMADLTIEHGQRVYCEVCTFMWWSMGNSPMENIDCPACYTEGRVQKVPVNAQHGWRATKDIGLI